MEGFMKRGKIIIGVILLVVFGAFTAMAGSNTTDQSKFDTAMSFMSQNDARLSRNAAYTLGELGDSRAVAPLVAELKSRDRHMRRIAAHALAKIGDQEAVMPLIEVLCNLDEDPHVQIAAVKALGKLGDNRAARILAHLASQNKSQLQTEAVSALEKLSPNMYAALTVNG
jgi:HEAT repeat protein